ncbi:MAG: chorismate mutase, partial [Clostridia bacterium]|nr:chorismate mutase [Clostridia bacterium]
MEEIKDIKELRAEINEIDEQIVELFTRRMEVSKGVALYKQSKGLPIFDPARERERLTDVAELAGEEYESYTRVLYALVMELSKNLQQKVLHPNSGLSASVRRSIEDTPMLFPEKAKVACQGVEGAYSGQACERLFALPEISYYKDFEGVFKAIEEGKCRYGVLPIENSTAGSVNAVYDLMIKYNFRIVRSLRLKVDHCLLARKGVKPSQIREVCSHEQAINQCAGFLRSLGNVKITVCPNTAVAAQMVANSGRDDIAALSSASCASLYGLS